jgi:PilZ domain
MMNERRTAERVKANLGVSWEGVLERHEGTVSDLSANGCFILTGGEVKDGELISIGFGLRFRELSATEQTLLALLIKHIRAVGV